MQNGDDERHAMTEQARYVKVWEDLRRRKITAFLLFVPVFLWAAWQVHRAPNGQPLFSPMPLLLFAAAVGAILWYSFFRCPRCGKPFFLTAGWRSLTGRRCVHCGLRRGASYEEARGEMIR
jgi:DNA-directed RNA polymerase subunit RPC12/RpoP